MPDISTHWYYHFIAVVIILLQHVVIVCLTKDKRKLELHTCYRQLHTGECTPPDNFSI